MVEMLPHPMMPTPSLSMPCSSSGPGGHGFARAARETGDVVRLVMLGDEQGAAALAHRGAERRPVHDAVAGIGPAVFVRAFTRRCEILDVAGGQASRVL